MPTICAQDLPTIFLCSESQVRRLIEAGRLVPQEDGSFDESEVEALVAEKATTREALRELTRLSQEVGGYSEMRKS